MEPCDVEDYLLNRRLRQYIMFTGLDLSNSAYHAAIYAEFISETRAGALSMNYGFLTPDHELFRRSSSVGATIGALSLGTGGGNAPALRKVGGLLKRAWPLKYLRHRPAIIVCFVDVEWDEANWPEKKTECESKINSLRQSLGARDTRLALVLVPRAFVGSDGMPAIPLSHNIVAEKKLELCAQCKLPTKNVFILPSAPPPNPAVSSQNSASEKATGEEIVPLTLPQQQLPRAFAEAITRCETTFHDIAQEAYMIFLKRIRARHVPNNDPRLLVRQQYKLGFISELRQDIHSALRYYKTAYQNVAELEVDVNGDAYEVLAVAGLLNFKVCELCFALNSANDAIVHFHRHQKSFFNRTPTSLPSRELAAIEFAWWHSQQYRLFAELFERAVASGLAAYAFQNPGQFLEESAMAFKRANALIHKLREQILSARTSPALENCDATHRTIDLNGAHTTFYGQRPWRDIDNGTVSTELLEHAAKLALEQSVRENYQRSLHLWSLAVAQFKRYVCDGAQNAVLIHMANDYVQLHKFGTALQLLHRVAGEFYARNLRCLLHQTLLKYLNIAYCMVNLNEYVWALVQLLNPALESGEHCESDEHDDSTLKAVEECSREFFARHFAVPPMSPQAVDEMIPTATYNLAATQWQQYYNHSVQVAFSVELSRLDAFLQCRARFLHPSNTGDFHAGDLLSIEVQIRNVSRISVCFDKCTLTLDESSGLTNSKMTLLEKVGDGGSRLELLGHDSITTLYFSYRPYVDGLGVKERHIMIRKMSLRVMGSDESKVNASFDYDMSGTLAPAVQSNLWTSAWKAMMHTIKIIPRRRQLRLMGPDAPIRLLIDEIIDVPFSLTNTEGMPLKRIKIIGHQIYHEDATDGILVPAYLHEVDEPLNPGDTINLTIRLSSKSKNCIGLQTQVTCQIDMIDKSSDAAVGQTSSQPSTSPTGSMILCATEGIEFIQRFNVDCIELFASSIAAYAINGDKLTVLTRNQCVTLEVVLLVQHAVRIQSVAWNLSDKLTRLVSPKLDTHDVYDVAAGERLKYRVLVQTAKIDATTLALGDLVVEWQSADAVDTVRNVISLGQLPLVSVPLIVEARVVADTLDSNVDNVMDAFVIPPLVVRQPFLIEYRLGNAGDTVLSLSVALDHSDAFIFAGLTELDVQLLPSEVYAIRILAIALFIGQLPFPRLNVRGTPTDAVADGRRLNTHVHNSLPATLYVLP